MNRENKHTFSNGDYYEPYKDYFGNAHKEYGGKLTDLRTIVGESFRCVNGDWYGGVIEAEKGIMVIPFGGPAISEENEDKYILTDENCGLYIQEEEEEE